MGRDVALYAKIRWRMMANTFFKDGIGQIIGKVIAAIFFAGISVGMAVGAAYLGAMLSKSSGFKETEFLFNAIFLISIVLALFSSIALAYASFFGRSDLSIWLLAPISVRSVFIGRYLEVLQASLRFFLILALPTLVVLGIASGAHPFYFVLLVPVSALVFSVSASFGTLVIFWVVKIVGIKRIKEAITASSALLGFLIFVVNTVVASSALTHSPGAKPPIPNLKSIFLPSSWAGQVLVNAGSGDLAGSILPGIALSILSVGLFAVALLVAERTYLPSYTSIVGEIPQKSRAKRGRSKAIRSSSTSPITSIVVKDLKMIARDAEEWINLLMPLALAVFIIFTGGGNRFAMPGTHSTLFLPYVMLLASAVTFRLSLTGIGRERKTIWALHQSPLPRRQIIIAKAIAAFLPAVTVSIAIFVIGSIANGLQPLYVLLGILFLPGAIVGISTLSSIFGASSPNLAAASAKELAKGTHGLLNFVLCNVYILLLAGLAALPQLGRLIGINTAILWAASLVVFYAAVVGSSFVFIAIASKFLERLEVSV